MDGVVDNLTPFQSDPVMQETDQQTIMDETLREVSVLRQMEEEMERNATVVNDLTPPDVAEIVVENSVPPIAEELELIPKDKNDQTVSTETSAMESLSSPPPCEEETENSTNNVMERNQFVAFAGEIMETVLHQLKEATELMDGPVNKQEELTDDSLYDSSQILPDHDVQSKIDDNTDNKLPGNTAHRTDMEGAIPPVVLSEMSEKALATGASPTKLDSEGHHQAETPSETMSSNSQREPEIPIFVPPADATITTTPSGQESPGCDIHSLCSCLLVCCVMALVVVVITVLAVYAPKSSGSSKSGTRLAPNKAPTKRPSIFSAPYKTPTKAPSAFSAPYNKAPSKRPFSNPIPTPVIRRPR